eukprot:2374866-Amphidinium_carterae.1
MWDNALRPGRARGPTRNLKQLAERLGWFPALGGWTCEGQWFSWDEATLRAKWDSAQVLCAKVARTRPDFEGLALGLSSSSMARVKRTTVRRPSMRHLEAFGMRNLRILPFKLETFVSAVVRKSRTLNTLFST